MRVRCIVFQVLAPQGKRACRNKGGLTAPCFCPLAALMNHIQFGDCHIGTSYNVSFTITNHSQANVIRFEWPLLATVSFSPQVSEGQSLFSTLC